MGLLFAGGSLHLLCELNTDVQLQFWNQQQHPRVLVHLQNVFERHTGCLTLMLGGWGAFYMSLPRGLLSHKPRVRY